MRLAAAAHVRAHVTDYYSRKCYCSYAEVGLCKWGRLRADIVALSMKRELVIIEVKSSMADFKADRKYHKYLAFAHKVYVAAPSAIIDQIKPLLHTDVGLMSVPEGAPSRSRKLRIVKPAKRQDIDRDMFESIVIRMAFRNSQFNKYRKRK